MVHEEGHQNIWDFIDLIVSMTKIKANGHTPPVLQNQHRKIWPAKVPDLLSHPY